jgi:DNA-binding NtrC family response regulator
MLLLREMFWRVFPKCDVSMFSKAENALPWLLAGGADILITDRGMGEWTGIDLIRELRSRGIHIPAVVLSNNHELMAEAFLAGATEFVHKEDDLAAMEAHIRALVEVLIESRTKPARKPGAAARLAVRPHMSHGVRKIGRP